MHLSDQYKTFSGGPFSEEEELFSALKPLMQEGEYLRMMRQAVSIIANVITMGTGYRASEDSVDYFLGHVLGELFSPFNPELKKVVIEGFQSPYPEVVEEPVDDEEIKIPDYILETMKRIEYESALNRVDCIMNGLTDKHEQQIRQGLDEQIGLEKIYDMIRDLVEVSLLNIPVVDRYMGSLSDNTPVDFDLSSLSEKEKIGRVRYLIAESTINIVHTVLRNGVLSVIDSESKYRANSFFSCPELFARPALN